VAKFRHCRSTGSGGAAQSQPAVTTRRAVGQRGRPFCQRHLFKGRSLQRSSRQNSSNLFSIQRRGA
jgi:hypothetical protein